MVDLGGINVPELSQDLKNAFLDSGNIRLAPASQANPLVTKADFAGLLASAMGNGVVRGLLDTPLGASFMRVSTVGLVVCKDGVVTAVADGHVAITANASGQPRVDLLQWNGVALAMKDGTAAASPACPSPDSGYIPIAVVYVPNGASILRPLGVAWAETEAIVIAEYKSFSGIYAAVRATSPDTVASAEEDLLGMKLPIYLPETSMGYELELMATIENTLAEVQTGYLTISVDGTDSAAAGWSTRAVGTSSAFGHSMAKVFGQALKGAGIDTGGIASGPVKIKGKLARNQGTTISITERHMILRQIR